MSINLNILEKILKNRPVRVPGVVKESFRNNFDGARNTEWSRHKGLFEVIFYHGEKEKIARFDQEGILLEYRINLQLDTIAPEIKRRAAAEGEIMNCIEFHSVDTIRYEFIVRDEKLVRYLLLTDMAGNRIRKEIL
ncbi:MAG: hypothetical protein MUC78_01430 [Bacteroidales bacterium]|jgi:hypothetical protein|nr:hypothetical protein [Bacteroidales bacterium]